MSFGFVYFVEVLSISDAGRGGFVFGVVSVFVFTSFRMGVVVVG